MQKKNKNKGFTLVELMIVIAILAILAAIVIFALNPAELFKRARDSQRMSDLRVLSSAISYYLADSPTPILDGDTNTKCVGGAGSVTIFSTATVPTAIPSSVNTFTAWTNTTSRDVGGAGWVKINFNSTGSAPIGQLPFDPSNSGSGVLGTMYTFACTTSLNYEINTRLESTSYASRMTADGGDAAHVYEVGTSLQILPTTTTNYFPTS